MTNDFFANKVVVNLRKRIDILFIAFCIILVIIYSIYISNMQQPIHDGAVYLLNAKSWLEGTKLYEGFRPQLLSWIISGIWILTGENWLLVKYIQSAFTIASGIILYLVIKHHKGPEFAFGVSGLTMLNGTVFANSIQILTEGLALFFLVLSLYSFKRNHWFLAGISIGLTFASRYTIVIQALAIFIMEGILVRKPIPIVKTLLATALVMGIVISAIYLKTNQFQTSLPGDSSLTFNLSTYYFVNSVDIWGLAVVLVPIALVSKRTYSDKFNYTFIFWFIVAIVFWSASPNNYQYRFTLQFTPAVYFLAILGAENLFYCLKSSMITPKRNQ
jgi:4-amino-4-deoxy-L-arabinose transferase-like glycosyltransferase